MIVEQPPPALTSLAELWSRSTRVHRCLDCGHLSTESFPAAEQYYGDQYDTVSGENDDLMGLDAAGQPIFRMQRQLQCLMDLIDAPKRGSLLDFGCGHGVFLRNFADARPHWTVHGFEVAPRYAGANVSIGQLPRGPFDLITAFYVFEHLENPLSIARQLADRLTAHGLLVIAVPDPTANPIDVLVADHLSHFSLASLQAMVNQAGLSICAASNSLLPASWIIVATRARAAAAVEVPESLVDLGGYWQETEHLLREFCAPLAAHDGRVAIYGAGVYGAYLRVRCGLRPRAFRCFIDRNIRKQCGRFHGLPVVDPNDIDAEVGTVLIGVRPDQCTSVAAMPQLAGRDTFSLPPWRLACSM